MKTCFHKKVHYTSFVWWSSLAANPGMTFFLRFLVPMWCRNLSGRFSPPWLNRSTQYFAAAACELCVSCLSLSFVKLPQGHASFARSSGMLLSILVPLHTLVIFTSIKSLLLLRRRVYIFHTQGPLLPTTTMLFMALRFMKVLYAKHR